MTDGGAAAVASTARHVCALLRDGRFRVEPDGRLPGFHDQPFADPGPRASTAGDPAAVLIAPTEAVDDEDGRTMISVFGSRPRSGLAGLDSAGRWLGVEEIDCPPSVRRVLADAVVIQEGRSAAPPLRPDWYRASWYDDVEGWIDERLPAGRRRRGPVQPVKVWSLSAVLRVPTDDRPVWFKACCDHFRAEPQLTRLVTRLAPEHAPTVIADDPARGWLLLDQLDGADEDLQLDARLAAAAADALAAVQIGSLDRLDEAVAAGARVRGPAATLAGFAEILRDGVELDQLSATDLAEARRGLGAVRSRFETLVDFGVPDTLVHGDLHPGNLAAQPDGVVLYDWTDAAIGPPTFDLVLLTQRSEPPVRAAAEQAYLARWRHARPDLDVAGALAVSALPTRVFQMNSYEQIFRNQEPAARWEMSGVLARLIRETTESLRTPSPADRRPSPR